MKKQIKLIILFCGLSVVMMGQADLDYKLYRDTLNGIKFEIPEKWEIQKLESLADNTYICIPTDPLEIEEYRECFDTIVFRCMIYEKGVEEFLTESDFYERVGDDYYTSDRFTDMLKTTPINKKNYLGIYHLNVCGISCEETGFYAAAGECETVVIGNLIKTVSISTEGKAFDSEVLKNLIDSFEME